MSCRPDVRQSREETHSLLPGHGFSVPPKMVGVCRISLMSPASLDTHPDSGDSGTTTGPLAPAAGVDVCRDDGFR